MQGENEPQSKKSKQEEHVRHFLHKNLRRDSQEYKRMTHGRQSSINGYVTIYCLSENTKINVIQEFHAERRNHKLSVSKKEEKVWRML